MPKTISTRTVDELNQIDDMDNAIVDGLESLRQRIEQAVRFRLGEWFLRTDRGVPYELLVGRTSAEAASDTITAAIRAEGGNEVREIRDIVIDYDGPSRIFRYRCDVDTIYGQMRVRSAI